MIEPSSRQAPLEHSFLFFSAAETGMGIVLSLLVGTLAGTVTGIGVIFGMATGLKTVVGEAISGENILPLRVTLLVPAMLLMSGLSFSELSSSMVCTICLTPW